MATMSFNSMASSSKRTTGWWLACGTFPALLWYALWASINTGPWLFHAAPSGLVGWQAVLRASAPLLLLPASLALLASLKRRVRGPKIMMCWTAYALVTAVGCFNARGPLDALYWAAAYLAVITCALLYVQGAQPLQRAIWLNRLSWIVATAMLLVLLAVARDSLFSNASEGGSGYGAFDAGDQVAGSAMSRSSGMARFAAVPAVLAVVQALSTAGWRRIGWVLVGLGSAYLIYFMQSRGAIVAYAFTIAFVMACHSSRTRLFSVPLAVGLALLLATESYSTAFLDSVTEHLVRRQSAESLTTLTGRTRAWQNGWEAVKQSPDIGYGPQADRMLIGEHVHNTYLYALMSGGFVGALAFVAGLAGAWLAFLRIMQSGWVDRLGQRAMLATVGGILAFFTVRGIPEVCGPMFGVDLMVMVPALMYLGLLERTIDQQRQLARMAMRRTPPPGRQSTVRTPARSHA
jgi:O-antigen ligase